MSLDQYSSPKIWGPHFWYILRCVAHNYPLNPTADDAQHVKTFLTELQYVLPCEICKYTFKQHFNKYPIEKGLTNRDKLIDWVEIIYEETKKAIQDKRVKILDTFENDDEVKPIKVYFKPKIDPLEEKLNQLRQTVINTEKKPNLLQIPTTPPKKNVNIDQNVKKVITSQIAKPPIKNKVHNMDDILLNESAGKITGGKKIDKSKSIIHSSPIDNSKIAKPVDKSLIKPASYIDNSTIAKINTEPAKKNRQTFDNTFNNKNIQGLNKKMSYATNVKNTMSQLVITKKCKKCEH